MRVFLRSEEKKKDNLKLKEAKEQAAEVEEATPGAEASQVQTQGEEEAEAQPATSGTQEETQGDAPASNGDSVKAEEGQEDAPNGVAQVRSLKSLEFPSPALLTRHVPGRCRDR